MAYLHNQREIVEMDFPLSLVWETIKKAISRFEWTIEKVDESTRRMQAKTKEVCFLSYSTVLSIEAKVVSDNVSRVTVSAETPVTTLTSVNFGKDRSMHQFFSAVAFIRTKYASKTRQKLINSNSRKSEREMSLGLYSFREQHA